MIKRIEDRTGLDEEGAQLVYTWLSEARLAFYDLDLAASDSPEGLTEKRNIASYINQYGTLGPFKQLREEYDSDAEFEISIQIMLLLGLLALSGQVLSINELFDESLSKSMISL